MHMADALITPLVGGTMWVMSTVTANRSINKVKSELEDNKIPLMGVMGAFVFTAQMINFSIPGTGSSGHLGGGMLLAILLGPYAGFLAMAAILAIQALFFADGGLLALGCNIFNLGFYTCFVTYPFIYKKMMKKRYTTSRIIGASVLASIIGLQLGAFSVVVQTMLSGKVDLSFGTFALLMQLIHLPIGLVEGLITAAVINFVWKARPELIEGASSKMIGYNVSFKKVLLVLAIVTIVIGGMLSWYASSSPDGLEWEIYHTAGAEEQSSGWLHQKLEELQGSIAILPDYSFKADTIPQEQSDAMAQAGTSLSGILGALLTLLLAVAIGWIIKLAARKKPISS